MFTDYFVKEVRKTVGTRGTESFLCVFVYLNARSCPSSLTNTATSKWAEQEREEQGYLKVSWPRRRTIGTLVWVGESPGGPILHKEPLVIKKCPEKKQ